MDPFTWISIAIMLAGAATSFVGSQQAADAAEEAGKAQQEAAAAAARNEELQTVENDIRARQNNSSALARLRAMSGVSGLESGGTLESSLRKAAGTMELTVQDSSRAGKMEAANLRSQGGMALWDARNQALGTRLGSYGTLLSGLTSAGQQASRSGLFGPAKASATPTGASASAPRSVG